MSCSFCGSRFHNIRYCRDPMISLLLERIKVTYVDILNQYPNDTEFRFKSVLNSRFNLRELRAVCATNTNFPTSRPKAQIIHTLYQYYSTRIYTVPHQEEEQPWLEARRLPTQPDPIPDFARDLEQSEEERDITWYIDTTPSPVSVLTFSLIQDRLTSPQHPIYSQMRQVNNRGPRYWDLSGGINLMPHFNAVDTTPQIKKYDIRPMLVSNEVEEGVEDCAICYESIKCMDLVKLNCEHKFCGSCITGSLKAHNNMYCGPSCALCRTRMVSFSVKNPEIYNLVSEHCNL